jgi:hypothetical protein
MKMCTKCKRSLPISEFTMTSQGYKPSCKSCERERVRQWAADNPDKEKAKSARRRGRGGGVSFDFSIRQKLFENQLGRCFYTGAILEVARDKSPVGRDRGAAFFAVRFLCFVSMSKPARKLERTE